ncbi:MAG TPA: SAM hydroxide adenosyltransferase [Opitutaceae bacterium]
MALPAILAAALAADAARAAPGAAQAADPATAPIKVDVGQIKGARFAIANPPVDWNRSLLLIAHGYRPESAPLLADLHPDRAANRALLNEGWMIATTSYRRNGLIIADAIEDLDALRAFIAVTYGDPHRVILEGESMGGEIVTMMAERDAGPYQGAVAFDATLYAKEPNTGTGLSLLPRIPLLFVATYHEYKQANGYLTALVSRPSPAVPPALFTISREGHTNINQPEHLAARRALIAWVERGRDALPSPEENRRYFDATIPVNPGPSVATMHADNRGFDTWVAEADAVYGNVLLQAQDADFDAAGIQIMTYFDFWVNGKAYRTLYGRTFTDVRSGEWVAFPDADGHTVLSMNAGDGAATAGLRVGDPVSISAVEATPPASH